jgi:hypothetical protein
MRETQMPSIPDSDDIYPEIFATRIMVTRLLTVVSSMLAGITEEEKSAREILVDIADLAEKDADNFMLHGLDADRELMYRERIRSKMQAIVVSATTGLDEINPKTDD